MKLRHRTVLISSIALFVFVAGVYGGSEVYRRRDCQQDFRNRKGQLVVVQETSLDDQSPHSLFHIQLESDRGIRVEGYVRIPPSDDGPYPALVMLGGLRTGKRILDYIEDTYDLVLVALDYPYEGKKSKLSWWEFLVNIPDMRKAIMNTVPAAMLSIDYLEQREDVDRDRIILIGGSAGALFAPAIAATDTRISAVAILFGAGDLQSLLRANIGMPAPIASVASWACAVLVSPVEPLKYVDKISPRPLLMLNGTGDPRMPARCSRLLHEKAKSPKTIRWIPAGHVHIRSKEFHHLVRQELEEWLVENSILSSDSTGGLPALH